MTYIIYNMYLNNSMSFIDIKSTFKDSKWIILWLYMQMASLKVQEIFIYNWEKKPIYISTTKRLDDGHQVKASIFPQKHVLFFH